MKNQTKLIRSFIDNQTGLTYALYYNYNTNNTEIIYL